MVGIVGCAVGAPFAVLIAEELFACGCQLLVSITSAGQITPAGPTPYFVIIDRALRDEGTSYHYTTPSEYCHADPGLVAMAVAAFKRTGLSVTVGASWTTDAPFRETAEAIAAARSKGVLAVEMEAAALYAFAQAANKQVLCLAHVTNTMGQTEQDFEKGEADGTADAMRISGSHRANEDALENFPGCPLRVTSGHHTLKLGRLLYPDSGHRLDGAEWPLSARRTSVLFDHLVAAD